MMRIWIGLLAAPLMLGLPLTAGAQEGSPPIRKGRDFWRNEGAMEKLSLSLEQIGQLEETGTDFSAQERKLFERYQTTRQELQAALSAEEVSVEEVERLGNELADLAAERSQLKTARTLARRRILTAEQWAELETGRRQRAAGMRKRMRSDHRGEVHRSRRWGGPQATE